jgi:hypothetical protein
MISILNYQQFIAESVKEVDLSDPQKKILSMNWADETMEGLRRHLLDKYMSKGKDKESEEKINKCITTYVYALDKKLKIDSDIVDMLADAVGKSSEDIAKELSKETVGYYDKFQNVIG